MQELEKILEEIDLEKKRVSLSRDCSNEYAVKEISLLEKIEKIIRKHMNDDWIPIEKEFPKKGENVLLCSDDGRMMIGVFQNDYYTAFGVAVSENYNQTMHNCVAWQSLPEPYRPKRSDNHDGE